MNNWQNEYMPEYHRQRITKEIEQIRLERLALTASGHCPNLFERTMITFANWLMSIGKQFRKRYEAPTLDCRKSPTGSFAE
jgi:hypothetical protein